MAWLRYQLQHRRTLNEVVPPLTRSGSIDCIYMSWLNYCDRACGVFGLPPVDIPISALHMHISIHEPQHPNAKWMSRISRSVTRRTMARLYTQPRLRTVAILVESFAEFARTTRMPGWQKLTYVPDIGSLEATLPRIEARAFYSLRPDQTVMLVFGALTRRKGVDILLKAVDALGDRSNVVVFLAGRQDAETQAQVADYRRRVGSWQTRIMVQDAFVNSDDERRLFSAADIVWVGYPGFLGSSGVLIQAGCAGLPIISGSHGEIGRVVHRSMCGLTCDLTNVGGVAATIRTLAVDRNLREKLGVNGRERSRQHSPEIFGANIYNLIQAAAVPALAG